MNPHRTLPGRRHPGHASRSSPSSTGPRGGWTSVGDIEWLGAGRSMVGGMYTAEIVQALLDDGRADGFPPELRNGQNLDAALEVQAAPGHLRAPRRPAHRERLPRRRGRACFFDWEAVQTGNWAQDVAYHLATVLSIEDRRAHERELLGHYLAELAAHGGPAIDFEEGVGAVPAELLLRLPLLGDHADPRPRRGARPHAPPGRGDERPRHVPSARGHLTSPGTNRTADVRAPERRRIGP